MWYALQIAIALWVAYFWTTLPENSPNDFGHGLYLGGIVAFFFTLSVNAITTLIRALGSKLLRRFSDLRFRSHKKSDQVITVSGGSRTRPPPLITKV